MEKSFGDKTVKKKYKKIAIKGNNTQNGGTKFKQQSVFHFFAPKVSGQDEQGSATLPAVHGSGPGHLSDKNNQFFGSFPAPNTTLPGSMQPHIQLDFHKQLELEEDDPVEHLEEPVSKKSKRDKAEDKEKIAQAVRESNQRWEELERRVKIHTEVDSVVKKYFEKLIWDQKTKEDLAIRSQAYDDIDYDMIFSSYRDYVQEFEGLAQERKSIDLPSTPFKTQLLQKHDQKMYSFVNNVNQG